MGLLDGLLADQGAQRQHEDFARRFDQGSPWEGFSDQEAHERHEQVSRHLSPHEYEEAAYQAFHKMSPKERKEFARYVKQQTRKRDVKHPHRDHHDDMDDPRQLAQMVGGIHQQQPGMLGGLMGGGGGGGMLGSPLAKVALGGIAAMAVKQAMNR